MYPISKFCWRVQQLKRTHFSNFLKTYSKNKNIFTVFLPISFQIHQRAESSFCICWLQRQSFGTGQMMNRIKNWFLLERIYSPPVHLSTMINSSPQPLIRCLLWEYLFRKRVEQDNLISWPQWDIRYIFSTVDCDDQYRKSSSG